jgi:hypothetical protein
VITNRLNKNAEKRDHRNNLWKRDFVQDNHDYNKGTQRVFQVEMIAVTLKSYIY